MQQWLIVGVSAASFGTPDLAVIGLLGCVVLVVALPPRAVVTGLVTLAVGVIVRLVTRRRTA